MHKRLFLAVASGVLLGGVLFFTQQQSSRGIVNYPETKAMTLTQRQSSQAVASEEWGPLVTGLERLPHSLQGVQVDGELQHDDQGSLILNADVRRVFDFFLNAVGEEQPERVSDRIRAYIRWQLPLPAAEQALLVLQEYLALRDAMTLEQHDLKVNAYRFSDEADLTASTLQQQKQKLLDMRSRYLSPEVDRAFYEEEDIFDDYTLSKLALMEDDEMSSADKSAAIASLEAGLPLAIQEQIVAVSRIQLLAKLRKTWQMEQGDAAGLRQLRESVVGAAAADRLEQLDQKRLNWHSRVDAWMQTRNHILAQEALAFQDRQAGVSRARAENFDTSELKRVQALEKLHDYSSVNGSQ